MRRGALGGNMNIPPYTTCYGTTIPSRFLRAAAERILQGDDWQRIMNEELRDAIPQHEEDYDEANEVYNYIEWALQEQGLME
jgi:hypothetical protein